MSWDELEKGLRVVYEPFEGCPEEMKEFGKVKSWNDHYVFVVYGNEQQAKATPMDRLSKY